MTWSENILLKLSFHGLFFLGNCTKIKKCSRIKERAYDKLAVSFLAFVHFASIWILLK